MASGSTGRKSSLSSLVHSSMFSGLGILQEGESASSEQQGHPIKTNRRERTSKTRLNFLSKSGAGIAATGRQASIDSTTDLVSPSISEHRPLRQMDSNTSVASSSEIEFPTSRSSVASGLVPRNPTVGDRSRSDSESFSLQDMLSDLDHRARRESGARTATRVLSQETAALVNQPISWEEDALSNSHIWHEHDTREACFLNDTQYCQQLKVFHPRRTKLRCSACKVLVHTTCIKQLYSEGICCKYTFREIRQKVKDSVKTHHFLNRRKAVGRCKKCEKGFGSWKKFSGRVFIGVTCSWCGDSYCPFCFDDSMRQEACHMGPLRNLIIPPSWIVRTPPELQQASSPHSSSEYTSPKNSRRKTRRSRRRRNDERASKNFTVKPYVANHKPLLVFINPKSGGNQGAKLLQTFQWLLNPRQVFDLSQGGPKFGLQFFQGVSNIRVLACGGDGTAGWVLSILDELDIRPSVPMAILPLGTGNDLARVLKWGGGYSDEPIDKILMHVEEGPVLSLDRWHLRVWPSEVPPDVMVDSDAVGDVPLHVINNYFSVGADAYVALEFHKEREANPERFNSRFKNKFFYSRMGGKDIFIKKFRDMTNHIQLWGDGEDLTTKIRQLRLEAICFLNIPSHGAGTNPWGNPPRDDDRIGPQKMNDGKIEVVGFWASTFAALQMGITHGERIAQCQHVKMITQKSLPIQIDGEACKLLPSVIEVGLKNQVPVVTKAPRILLNVETPLRGVIERVKLSVSKVSSDQYDRHRSDVSELKRIATSIGIVHGSAKDSLKTVRAQINLFTTDTNEDGEEHLSKSWRFLDIACSGRVERMFQVLPDQEESVFIGDMFSDGLFVVELSQSQMATEPTTPKIQLLSPTEVDEGDSDGTAESKRKAFGRNPSYELATNEQRVLSVSPPSPSPLEPTPVFLEVHNGARSPSSESTTTPIVSDEDLPGILPNRIPDTDSGETDPNSCGPSSLQKALFDSVKRGRLAEVKDYHRKGAKLTATDCNGWTPIHHAARLEKTAVLKYLVENVSKACLDIAEDEKVQTALHKAAWFGYVEICKILVEAGASLDRKDYQGNTPYDKAIQSGDAELTQYLNTKKSQLKWSVQEDKELAI